MEIIYGICISCALICILCIAFYVRKQRYIKFLRENSVSLKNLELLNAKYKFNYNIKNYNECHTYDNEIFYNNVSCEDYLLYQLQFKKNLIKKEIMIAKRNREQFRLYSLELESVKEFGEYNQSIDKLNKKYLLKLEEILFNEKKLKPTINFEIYVRLNCSKINGTIYRYKWQIFSVNEILSLIEKLGHKEGDFYIDRNVWDAICRVERGKVSNRIRFAIYKRDGYRCRICGRSEKFDDLEIDHIKPIAKGGKSTYNNLQTLCRRCNKEKGDKY